MYLAFVLNSSSLPSYLPVEEMYTSTVEYDFAKKDGKNKQIEAEP